MVKGHTGVHNHQCYRPEEQLRQSCLREAKEEREWETRKCPSLGAQCLKWPKAPPEEPVGQPELTWKWQTQDTSVEKGKGTRKSPRDQWNACSVPDKHDMHFPT